jgi:DNA transformation protein
MRTSEKILNIGPKSAAWLRQVGIRSLSDLEKFGAAGVFWKVKKAGFKPSLNLLYALSGAEKGRHWTTLSPAEKHNLLIEANALEDAAKAEKSRSMPAQCISIPQHNDNLQADDTLSIPRLFDNPDESMLMKTD